LGLYLSVPINSKPLLIGIEETGTPIIQKFVFPDFCNSVGKISIYEDPNGFFILGANDKIILFYGNEFLNIPLKGQVNIISNQKSVFYTGYNTLGIIKIYKNSLPQLIPLVSDTGKSDFGQIDKVYLSDDLLIFNNNKKIFSTKDGKSFNILDSSQFFIQLFRVKDKIYINKPETGLSFLSGEKIISLKGTEIIKPSKIASLQNYDNGLLIKTNNEKNFLLYSFKDSKIKPVFFGFEDLVEQAGFSDAIFLPSGQLLIGTKGAGVFFYDNNLHSFTRISTNEGLLDNYVSNLHIDKAGNLWIIHENGLCRMELNISLSSFGINSGITGTVNDIYRFKNKLYIATTDGFFRSDYESIGNSQLFKHLTFVRDKKIINKCFRIIENNKKLFVFSSNGIELISDNEQKTILRKEIIACDIFYNIAEKYIFIGNADGLSIYKLNNSEISLIAEINGIGISDLAADSSSLWIRTTDNRLGRLYLPLIKGKTLTIQFFDSKYGLPQICERLYFLKTIRGIKFCYSVGIYEYNSSKNIFELSKDEIPAQLEGFPRLAELFVDRFKNHWYSVWSNYENIKGLLLFNDNKDFSPFFLNTGMLHTPIFNDSNIMWIGGTNILYRFDYTKKLKKNRNFAALIKRVIIGEDSVLLIQLEEPEISYRYRNIKFIVSSTCFEGEPFIRYQYRLLGFNKKWSSWDRNNEISFQNLNYGNYIFQLRALNIDGITSDITELSFCILTPFYRTTLAYIIYFALILFILFVLLRYRTWLFIKKKEEIDKIVQKRTAEILQEKEKSEQLIANLLPKETADELKQTGKASSQKYSLVTVLFSDIQGFTKIAEQMNPEILIDQLDSFFFQFDSVVEKYNIEKIKTIGDAYMCAGGIPNKNITNPIEVVLAALEMQEYMRDLKRKNANIWDLRIGIHTGSVIAGVVGHKKLSYDIWGDTVNTASRMESSGEAGKINISGQTYELVKDFFVCQYRGKMPVKYKGEIDMYFVEGIHPELSANDSHTLPNDKFFHKLQLLRLQDLEDLVFEKLKNELPENLYFHNINYLKEVYNTVKLYSCAETLTDEDILILHTAALIMDIGYIYTYDDHEAKSIEFAKKILPSFKYKEDQIIKITQLIELTKGLRKPETTEEKIIIDAEMTYLSRADYPELIMKLYQEMVEYDKIGSIEEWINMQIVLLSNHIYYTPVANKLRDVLPEQQIEKLLKFLKK